MRNEYYKAVKVLHVVLDGNDPKLSDVSQTNPGWDALGLIFFSIIDDFGREATELSNLNVARPFFSNIKHYPLVNEIVCIISLPDPNINGDDPYSYSYYYLNTVNIWNHPHHNALLFLTPNQLNSIYSTNPNEGLTYEDINNGLSKNEFEGKNKINIFGDYFKERKDIKPLLPFEGDIIYEGRYGQSIRFGSTNPTKKDKNTWSSVGDGSDPITIIRNGQYASQNNPEGWVPTVEDINLDGSSIYLCENQIININVSSNNLKSFDVTSPNDSFDVISIKNTVNSNSSFADSPPTDKTEKIPVKPINSIPPPVIKPVYNEDNIVDENPLNTEVDEFIVDENHDEETEDNSKVRIITPEEATNIKKEIGIKEVFTGNSGTPYSRVALKQGPSKDAWEVMVKQAAKDGVTLILGSAYRSPEAQRVLRKQNVIDKTKVNDDLFINTAHPSNFKPITAAPQGQYTSNHIRGIAFDIDLNTSKKISSQDPFNWLKNNAHKYDIVRTVESETWHWEYRPDLNKNTYSKVSKSHPSWS